MPLEYNIQNENRSKLDAGLSYAALGWRVIPLAGKIPCLKDWPVAATIDNERIRHWFGSGRPHENANIGIVCGSESGLVALDIDPRHGGDASLAALEAKYGALPATVESQTGGGGRHLLFKHPQDAAIANNSNRLGPGIDVKATGGQIVAPPSIHPDTGETYGWKVGHRPHDIELAELPMWLIELLVKPALKPKIDYSAGERNTKLASYAGRLRAQGAEYVEIEDKLQQKNIKSCTPPLSESEVEVIARSISNYILPARESQGAKIPQINAKNEDLQVVSEQAWRAILQGNDPPRLFCHGGLPVRVEKTTGGAMAMRGLTQDRLSHELARVVDWYRVRKTKDGEITLPAAPPRLVVVDMLAYPSQFIPLPRLERVSSAPLFTAGGELLVANGYYPCGTLLQADADLTVAPVPPLPTESHLIDAERILTELLVDFPFVQTADRTNAIALMILSFARDLIDGPTPLHLIEAPQAGTGKGLLANLLLMPGCGSQIGAMSCGRDEDETRKRLTAMLREGKTAVLLDNVTDLTSAALSSALTATIVSDRLLGASEMLTLSVRCAWVATGNNPALTTEIARRSVRIRLDAKVDRPWSRDPRRFKHSRLYKWARAHRGELAWAALTLIQNWLAAGRPEAKVRPLGSYESWTEVIGGILEHAGYQDFLANLDDLYERTDIGGGAWRAFVEAWWEDYHDQPLGVADLYRIALAIDELDLGSGSERAQKVMLGQALARHRDTVFGGWSIEQAGRKQRVACWRLHQVLQK